jgi:hypothetical protein
MSVMKKFARNSVKPLFFLRIIFMMTPLLIFADGPDAQELYEQAPLYIHTPENLMEMKHAMVVDRLQVLHGQNQAIELKEVGVSAEGRSINMLSFGQGKVPLLLWSQMHGDEPTATAALLAVFDYLAGNFESAYVKNLYQKLRVNAIVMLNPDGAERFVRRNAQGIDINRDANRLSSPEGQTLRKMYEQINPLYGFNLHDMRGRETVGDSGELLSIALMAPPFNKENEDNPSRRRAKKLVLIIKDVLDLFIDGHVARYKADYMPRAFGDAFQNWGVSTVLVESGLTASQLPHHLVRLNFVLLLNSFSAIANDQVDKEDDARYDKIPLEGKEVYDLLIKEALICNGRHISPYRADIGINIDYYLDNGRPASKGRIDDIGELSASGGRMVIDASRMIVMPGFIMQGDTVRNPQLNYEQGITTLIYDADKPPPDFPSGGQLALPSVPLYTRDQARRFGLSELGLIDKDQAADLIIFKATEKEVITQQDLRYVIKNGQIVFEFP